MSEKHKQQEVVQGLKCCKALDTDCSHCPYMAYVFHCRKHLIKDAHTVIIQIAKERDEAIAQLPTAVGREREEEGE